MRTKPKNRGFNSTFADVSSFLAFTDIVFTWPFYIYGYINGMDMNDINMEMYTINMNDMDRKDKEGFRYHGNG